MESEKVRFFYGGKILNNPNYLSKKVSELRIRNNSTIRVEESNNIIGGGFAVPFSDPEKEGPIEIDVWKEAPDYRTVFDGLNLFGNCYNKSCVAYEKEVVHRFGFGTFDVLNDVHTNKRPVCPECEIPFIPITAGFMNCSYKYIGEKVENGQIKNVDWSKTTYGRKHVDYLESKEKNMSTWVSLKITASKI